MNSFNTKKRLFLFIILICLILLFVLIFFLPNNLLLSFLPKPQAGTCQVFEEKYCREIKPVYYNDVLIGGGIKVPKGTKLFAPFSGDINNQILFTLEKNGQSKTYPGTSIDTLDTDGKTKISVRATYFNLDQKSKNEQKTVKGNVVGAVSDQTIDYIGDYNVIISFKEFDSSVNIFKSSTRLNKEYLGL